MAREKILFVTGSLVHGGAERHSITLLNRLAERDYECHAVYIKNDPSQLERIQLRNNGTVRCLNARYYLDLRALGAFVRHLHELRPSIVVAANPYATMYAWLALRFSKIRTPLVVTYHTTKLKRVKERLQMLLYRFFFWTSARCIFVSENQRRYCVSRGVFSRTTKVIHNGIDVNYFCDRSTASERAQLRADYGFSAEDYVIGISAVLRPGKNHGQLLDAIAELRHRDIPACALIIGDGPLRMDVEAHARTLGIERYVRITGFKQDVRPYLAICDVTTLCSVEETFSLAALEAMAMQKAVIHSNIGGASEMIIEGENGFMFPVGDTGLLIEKLLILCDRKLSKKLGQNARKIVEERFSENKMIDCYEAMFLEMRS